MGRLNLTLACADYDRTRALADGRVQAEGIDLNVLNLEVEEIFFRMLRSREFDAAEMSLSSYCMTLGREEAPFVALPVFPSRFFRHSCIFVSTASGIERPEQLAGKRIGVPEYQMTAPVWIRGILADEHGVDPASPAYFSGGLEEPGRIEKLALDLPDGISVTPIGPAQTLSRMLRDGDLDALHSARAPSSFYTDPDRVRRLFPEPVAVERDYFRRTGIFPIMHVVVLRRDVYERHRWAALSLCKAFAAAQRLAYQALNVTAALATMLPWQIAAVEEARALMGADWWPYGLERNRDVLATFLRYHHAQGLSKHLLAPEELFAPETLESFRI
ncbi:MAG TPA: ABC transporter substrate-binding protein [Allosphingosinicella sp.]|nr:ABC transporter substrate-binding protein [Allosphingosinicella sp.]